MDIATELKKMKYYYIIQVNFKISMITFLDIDKIIDIYLKDVNKENIEKNEEIKEGWDLVQELYES